MSEQQQHQQPEESQSPVQPLVAALLKNKDLPTEIQFQQALNNGSLKLTSLDNKHLRAHGYYVTHRPETVAKFSQFNLRSSPELTEAIQKAKPETGLLVDRNKMYRPGPATFSQAHPSSSQSFLGAVAKGYDEIFQVFELFTNEKQKIGENLGHFLRDLICGYPSQLESFRIYDLGCGNGVQTKLWIQCLRSLLKSNEVKAPPLDIHAYDNMQGCVDSCRSTLGKYSGRPDITIKCERVDVFSIGEGTTLPKADCIILSHFYTPQANFEKLFKVIEALSHENTIVIMVNGTDGTESDEITRQFPKFLREKLSSTVSEDYERQLQRGGFMTKSTISKARVEFPFISDKVKDFLTKKIERGDYEEFYSEPPIDPDVRTTKALMEFFASYPLESMTYDERKMYIEELERRFQKNHQETSFGDGAPQFNFLTQCNRIVFAIPNAASPEHKAKFLQRF